MNTKALYDPFYTKPIPRSILIVGASGRIGGPAAEFLTDEAPSIKLRLSTSNENNVTALQEKYPGAEVIVSDYMNPASLEKAVDGIEGIFCLTSGPTKEKPAMENLVAAIKNAGTLIHMVRQLGLTPEVPYSRLPDTIKRMGSGLPIEHPIARKILDDAEIPVTFVNTGATFMSNFAIWMAPTLRKERKLVWPERRVPYIDTNDVGEIAARLLLSNDVRHIGKFHTINNGCDFPTFEEVAELMSDVWGEKITYDGTQEAFETIYSAMGEKFINRLSVFFDYERSLEPAWSLNDCAERILGRKPKTLREWLVENRRAVLGTL